MRPELNRRSQHLRIAPKIRRARLRSAANPTGRKTYREGFEAKPCGVGSKTSGFVLKPIRFALPVCGLGLFPHGFEREHIRMDATADVFGSFPCGNKSFPHGNDFEQVIWNQRMQRYEIFPCGIESFPHGNGPSPHVFDSFRCGFSPSTIGLVLETCGFMRFRFCSVPDPYVLAADPGFFAPDRCGHGVEKTVHEVWTVHLQPTTIQPKKEK